MARCLVLDWNHDNCRILAANVARSGVQIDRTLLWPQAAFFAAAHAEDAGKKLHDLLKHAGLAGLPVLICLPRQRVLLKEIRCPNVPAAEEAGLVHFQAAKDLLETPDDVVIDYAVVARTATEIQVLVAALRKDVLAAYQTLCKAAGLKLLAVTPRPFVLAHCLARARQIAGAAARTTPVPQWSAVVHLGENWGELTVLHGDAVIYARSLSGDADVAAEVRRSLATFVSQPQGQAPETLYLFGDDVAAQAESLQKALKIPVLCPQYLAESDAVARDISCPAGVGLLCALAQESVPVNFAAPKEPKPPAPPRTRQFVLAGVLGLLLLVTLMVVGNKYLEARQAEIDGLIHAKEDKKKELDSSANSQDRADLEYLDKWDQGSVAWVDEVYDMVAHFPHEKDYYLTRMHADVLAQVGDKDRSAAKLSLSAVEPQGTNHITEQFVQAMKDDHRAAHMGPISGQKYTLDVSLDHQPAKKFTTRMQSPDGDN